MWLVSLKDCSIDQRHNLIDEITVWTPVGEDKDKEEVTEMYTYWKADIIAWISHNEGVDNRHCISGTMKTSQLIKIPTFDKKPE